MDEHWYICKQAEHVIQSGSTRINCPDPRRICPTFFCPYDCLGTGGECDYDSGKCLCQYENSTHPGETVSDVCGMVEEIKEYGENRSSTSISTTAITLRPILQKKGKIDSMMPPSDTKLSDYYVSDVLHLDDEPHRIDAWGILILSITGLVLISFFVTLFTFRKSLRDASAVTWNYLDFWRKRSEQADDENNDDYDGLGRGGSGHGSTRTRDKHKMVASVLVDMRIRGSNSNSNWRRIGRDRRDLNDSLAETDGRMTDSEIASSAAPALSDSLSEISSRQMESETMSDLEDLDSNTSREVINEVDLVPPEVEEPPQQAIIRRRRLVPNMFA